VELDSEHNREKKDKIKDNDRLRIIEIEFLTTLNYQCCFIPFLGRNNVKCQIM